MASRVYVSCLGMHKGMNFLSIDQVFLTLPRRRTALHQQPALAWQFNSYLSKWC